MPFDPEHAGELIKKKRLAKGFTQEQVAERLGLKNSNYLGMLEKGRVGVARSKYLQPLADLLDLTNDEVRQINPDAIVEVKNEPAPPATKGVRPVPVRALAGAGTGVYREASIISVEYVLDELYRPGMEVVEIHGDSMAPGIHDGDYAYIDPSLTDPVDNKIFLVLIHDDGYVLKRTRLVGTQWLLFSDNPEHAPLTPSQARIVGRMYYHQPKGRAV